ncbi:MAG: hypothetical protein ABSF67_01765 [Roseiarcus sp.]|jgi:hypothetical protein
MKLAGLFVPRFAANALAARSPVDIALFGFGVTSAAASVVFAAVMFTRAGDAPMVNGMQYLSVFAQPHRHIAVVASVEPAPARAAAPAPIATKVADSKTAAPARADPRQSIDMSPTGSIVRGGDDAPADADPYRLVAVEPGMAWLRNSVETRVIKTGDFAPGLGRVAAIVERQGRWTLLDESGAVLLAADPLASPGAAVNPFSRRMIFGGD